MRIRSGSFRITTGASGRGDSSATSSSISRCSYFVVKDTDVALVVSGGRNERTLFGLDLGRGLGWAAVHAAVYEGAEMLPRRDDTLFLRVVAGALRTSGENAFALEYFYNGEGYSDAGTEHWLAGLDEAWAVATNLTLPPEEQQRALAVYAAGATIPYTAGLGLRRNYLSRSTSTRCSSSGPRRASTGWRPCAARCRPA